MSKEEAYAAKKAAKKLAKAKAKAEAGAQSQNTTGDEPAPATASAELIASGDVNGTKKEKKQKRKVEEVDGATEEQESKKVKQDTAAEGEQKVVGMEKSGSATLSKKELKKLEKQKRKAEAKSSDAPATAEGSNSTSASSDPSTSTLSIASASATQAETDAYLLLNNITVDPTSTFPAFLSTSSLPINPSLRPFVEKFPKPTPIQATSWPALFQGRDVVGIAETGSGKTLAFGLPGLQLLSTSKSTGSTKGKKPNGSAPGQIQLLVVAPTRELATQTFDTLKALGELVNIGAVCLYGGVGKDEQLNLLRKKEVRIVVGTPGRILDLANSSDVDFSGVKYLVLDEADRMLDQGFENDIRRIIAYCPSKEDGRQTVMFSATWPESVRRLASTFLSQPVKITVGSDELTANKRIEQVVEVLDNPRDKEKRLENHLRAFMKNHPKNAGFPARALVFALYKKEATRIELTLRHAGFSVAGLHGDLGQDARFRALDAFKTGKVNILVATDVAARGLDIPDVGLVINVTFPLTTEDFVHRCGRTGRAGKSGKAITYFTGENHERSLAGEFMRVLRDAGAEIPAEMDRFPSTIKKKEHGVYGAFYKDTSDAPAPKKIVFD